MIINRKGGAASNSNSITITSRHNNRRDRRKPQVKAVHLRINWIDLASGILLSRTALHSWRTLLISYRAGTKNMRTMQPSCRDPVLNQPWLGTLSRQRKSTHSHLSSEASRTDWLSLGKPTNLAYWPGTWSNKHLVCQRVNRFTVLWTMNGPMGGQVWRPWGKEAQVDNKKQSNLVTVLPKRLASHVPLNSTNLKTKQAELLLKDL